jgi:hypothetical protein
MRKFRHSVLLNIRIHIIITPAPTSTSPNSTLPSNLPAFLGSRSSPFVFLFRRGFSFFFFTGVVFILIRLYHSARTTAAVPSVLI